MLGPGSHTRWLEERGRVARAWVTLVRGNHHVIFPLWLLVVANGLAGLALHHYDPSNWLHWAHVVFFTTTPLALAIAWLGDRTKRLLG